MTTKLRNGGHLMNKVNGADFIKTTPIDVRMVAMMQKCTNANVVLAG